MKIGILGGIGPEATGYFYLNFINKLQKKGMIKSNADYPQIIINSIPAPELIGDVTEEKLEKYIEGLKELDRLKPDIIAMICNTIHAYHGQLQKHSKTPIIDLNKQVEAYLIKKKIRKIAVIGTKVSREMFVFKQISCIEVIKNDQAIIDNAIFEYNNTGKANNNINKIAGKMLRAGAESILVACTEMSLILNDKVIPKIDTMEILCDTLVEYCESTRFK